MTVADFLAMGGYAPYVWSAFGVTFLVVVGNVIAARRRWRQTRARLELRLARQGQRSQTQQSQQQSQRSSVQ